MYKVFIQNKPLFFVERKKVKKEEGIFVPVSVALLHHDYVLQLLQDSPITVPVFIVCKNPEADLFRFFSDYLFVEAAGGIVVRKGEYLFIKRNGIWDLPKGKIDAGENSEQAALREIEEECGVKCDRIERKLLESYHTYNTYGPRTLKRTYWYELSYSGKKQLLPQQEEGITEAVWVSKKRMKEIRKETFSSLVEVIDKLAN